MTATETADVVVLGAGPAGLNAALTAADAGAAVLLVDENEDFGGQIYRRIPYRVVEGGRLGADYEQSQHLFEAVRKRRNIATLLDATVWGVFPERVVAVAHRGRRRMIKAKALILATGAYDRAVPFPGWTLPGVLSAGGALTMIKSQRILPGHRVLLAGTGPIQLVLAKALLDAGAEVVALADGSTGRPPWRHLPSLFADLHLLRQGLGYLFEMRRRRVPMLYRHTVVRVEGDDRARSAVVARVDQRWAPLPGTERTFAVDAVICSFGFVPSTELTSLCGCDHGYREAVGGWVPHVDAEMQTSVPGVFAAGETSGVAGAIVAADEGRLAGVGAVRHLGLIRPEVAAEHAARIRKRLDRLYRFRSAIDALYAVGPGLSELITPETVVCRCEEVLGAAVEKAVADGASSLRDVKMTTRAGMGYCQGRMCAPSISHSLARRCGVGVEHAGFCVARPPVRPVSLGAMV